MYVCPQMWGGVERMEEGQDKQMLRSGRSQKGHWPVSQPYWASTSGAGFWLQVDCYPLYSLRAVTPLTSQLSCLECKTCILEEHLFQIWAHAEGEKPWGQGWKCRMSVHGQFWEQPLNTQACEPTNRLWSWRLLPGNLSVKTVSHIDFPLQYFLTWPEPSYTELPSVLLSGTCREDRHLSTQAKTQQWHGGLVLVGAIGEQLLTPNDKLIKLSTDPCLVRAMVKRSTQPRGWYCYISMAGGSSAA